MGPTQQDLEDPIFEAIWQAIKGWDIRRSAANENPLYSGATGTDVIKILTPVRDVLETF